MLDPAGNLKVRRTKPGNYAKIGYPKASFTLKTQLFPNNQNLTASSYYLVKFRHLLIQIFTLKSSINNLEAIPKYSIYHFLETELARKTTEFTF